MMLRRLLALAILGACCINGKSLLKKLKGKIDEELRQQFTNKELKEIKHQWQRWKISHREKFIEHEDDFRFGKFIENFIAVQDEIKEAKEQGLKFNLTLDGPFSKFSNDEFRQRVLMRQHHVDHTREKRSLHPEYVGGWPFEVPDWIKACAPTLSCGMEHIEFSWECAAPKAYDQGQIDHALAMDGRDKVDYRTSENPEGRPLVTPTKDQGMCGSCWSFSATGALEGLMLKHNKAPQQGGTNDADPNVWLGLSEQQLVDCTLAPNGRRKMGPFVNHGCDGGWPTNAFIYAGVNEGLMGEWDYPYNSGYTYEPNSFCAYDSSFDGLDGNLPGQCYSVTPDNEDELAAALYYNGPVTIVVDSGGVDWQLYREGIAEPRDCAPNVLNHAVLLVGYGVENGQKYWIIKNSWGDWWGEGGYMRLKRGHGNLCGVATMANYPTFDNYSRR